MNLGTAAGYAVLAGSTVTSTGPTIVSGNLGLSPGTSVTGFRPGLMSGGVQNVANPAAVQAKADLVAAYDEAAGQTPATPVAAPTLGGLTLTPGVYSGGALDLTGTLTLDAQGDTGAVFVFQAASTLITASASQVKLINGASPCNVFWKVGSSATLGTTTSFKGTIMALTSITLNTGATVEGRLLARNGAVTLDSNTVNAPRCSSPPAQSLAAGVGEIDAAAAAGARRSAQPEREPERLRRRRSDDGSAGLRRRALGERRLHAGELVDRELVDGELVDGELVDGELVNRELVDGELVDGELVDRELVDRELATAEPPPSSDRGAAPRSRDRAVADAARYLADETAPEQQPGDGTAKPRAGRCRLRPRRTWPWSRPRRPRPRCRCCRSCGSSRASCWSSRCCASGRPSARSCSSRPSATTASTPRSSSSRPPSCSCRRR